MKTLRYLLLYLVLLAPQLYAAGDGPPAYHMLHKNLDVIPTYTNIVDLSAAPYYITNDLSADQYSKLTNAIGLSPDYSTFLFSTGTVVLRSTVMLGNGPAYMNKHVTFRGRGRKLTHVKSETTSGSAFLVRQGSVISFSAPTFITSGATKGSYSLTLTSTNGYTLGDYIKVGQTNDPAITWGWLVGGPRDPGPETQGFFCRITNITSTTIGINVAVPEDYTNQPFIRKPSENFGGIGWEDMTMTMTNRDTAAGVVQLIRATNCWFTGVHVTNHWNRGIIEDQAYHTIIERSIVEDAENHKSSTYGIQSVGNATGIRILNSVVGRQSAGILASYGSIYGYVGYCYSPSTWPTNYAQDSGGAMVNAMAGMVNFHGANAQFWTVEGCIGGALYIESTIDLQGGTNLWSGISRGITSYGNNWVIQDPTEGWPSQTSQALKGIEIEYGTRGVWAYGNVLGTSNQIGLVGWSKGTPTGCEQGCQNVDSVATNSTNLRWVDNWSWWDNALISWNGDTYTNAPLSLMYGDTAPSWWPPGVRFPAVQAKSAVKVTMLPAQYMYYDIPLPSLSTNYFVSTNGSPSNPGTLTQPWDLQRAMTNKTYADGDVVYLLDGLHRGPLTDGRTNGFVFQAQTSGGSGTVNWLPYRGARAIVDACRIQVSGISGYHVFKELEFTTLLKTNHLTDASERWQLWDGSGLNNLAFVNCLLTDVPQAWGNTTKELRGNAILYGGATSFEHGWYGGGGNSNRVIGNIFHSSAGEPIKFAPTSDVDGADIIGNIVINPGFLSTPTGPNYAAVMGPGSIMVRNLRMEDNYLLVDPLYPNTFTDNPILHPGNASSAMADWAFRRNYILGPDITAVKFASSSAGRITNLVFTGNTIANKNAGSAVDRSIFYGYAALPGTPSVNSNAYYNAGGATARFQFPDGVATTSFTSWTNSTGFDVASSFTGNSYPPNVIKVLPNSDTVGRGHVVAVNNTGLSQVSADLGSLMLLPNQQFLMMSAQALNNPAGWKTNSYTAAPVNFSLDPADWPTSTPRTFADFQAPSNGLPRFGAWIIIPGPLRPTAIAATPNGASNQVTITWTTVGTNWNKILVQRKSGVGAWTTVATLADTATSWVDTDVATGGSFVYRVATASSYVDSGPSPEAAVTLGIAAPTGLTVGITGPSSSLLVWSDNALNETMYVVERKVGSGGTWSEVAILSAGVTAFAEFQLSPLTTYFWRVRARNATLSSDYSNEASGVTLGLPPPPPPTAAIPPRFKRTTPETFILP